MPVKREEGFHLGAQLLRDAALPVVNFAIRGCEVRNSVKERS
jgi:hypothetical protein